MEEIWKGISGYEDMYEISSLGRVRRKERLAMRANGRPYLFKAKELTLTIQTKNGYAVVSFCIKLGQKFIHRLVAEAFIPNPEGFRVVNHLNGIKVDNRIENLEWCTHRDNVLHYRQMKKVQSNC